MDADVLEVHDIIDNVEQELRKNSTPRRSYIWTPSPPTIRGQRHAGQVAGLVREIDPAMTIHDFRMTAGPDHQNLIFDTVVPYQCALTDEEVKAAIAQKGRGSWRADLTLPWCPSTGPTPRCRSPERVGPGPPGRRAFKKFTHGGENRV